MAPRPTHVLIVDDDEDLREMVGALLLSEGHSSSAAADGRAALVALATGPRVGVVVLDLQMPVMDGRTFLAHKARGAHASVPVIVFSSSPSLGLMQSQDVVAVISKGAGIEGLLSAISTAGSRPWAPAGGFDG